jgi:hypothetical protein
MASAQVPIRVSLPHPEFTLSSWLGRLKIREFKPDYEGRSMTTETPLSRNESFRRMDYGARRRSGMIFPVRNDWCAMYRSYSLALP